MKWILILALVFCVGCGGPTTIHPPTPVPGPSFTVMYYAAYDCANREDEANSLINQLAWPVHTERIKVTAQVDALSEAPKRYEKKQHGMELVETLEESSTGDPMTLVDFVVSSALKNPSENYILVLLGHGGGWYGFGVDGHDWLNEKEITEAFAMIKSAGVEFEAIVFDSCFMANYSIAKMLKAHTRYLVASPNASTALAIPHGVTLADLGSKPINAQGFCMWVVERYRASNSCRFLNGLIISLAAIDLEKLPAKAVKADPATVHAPAPFVSINVGDCVMRVVGNWVHGNYTGLQEDPLRLGE